MQRIPSTHISLILQLVNEPIKIVVVGIQVYGEIHLHLSHVILK